MELLQFIQTQTYYFPQEPNELQQILNLVQNKDLLYSINYNNKIVQYHFNLQQWICLSDLLSYYVCNYMKQKQKFLLVRFWQFLKIIKKIIDYLDDMRKQFVTFQFITEDRIWIKIKEGSPSFSIERENVEFQIIIVGHGCPIFENREFKAQDDEISITQIIKNIFGLIKYTFREYALKSEILYDICEFNQLQKLNQKLHNILSLNKQKQYKKLLCLNRKDRFPNLQSNLNQLWQQNNCFFSNLRFIKMKYILQQALPLLIEGLDYYLYFKTVSIDDQMILEFDQIIQSTLKFNITPKKLLKIVNNKISSLNARLNQNTRIKFSIQTDELQKLIFELELDDLKFYSFNSLKAFRIKFKELLTSFIEFKLELLFNQFIEQQISNIFDSLQ